jgi:SAM-dependent methyltransferase
MSVLDRIHGGYVFNRRVRVLCRHLVEMIPPGSNTVLDVGCGDGTLAWMVGQERPELGIEGIDVLVRTQTRIPVIHFDGVRIPKPDKSIDVVTFVDVLHHTLDPRILLAEASRVARHAVILKDHRLEGLFAGPVLRGMDWVGNARHGVVLPYNYQTPAQWKANYRATGLEVVEERVRIGLYPFWASWIFGRQLHTITHLRPLAPTSEIAGPKGA